MRSMTGSVRGRAFVASAVLGLCLLSAGARTDDAAKREGARAGVPTIGTSVTVVEVDAVALDKKGRQVRDLTAGDFEIKQDGQPQRIVHCIYVDDERPAGVPSRGGAVGEAATAAASVPAAEGGAGAAARSPRTVAIVIDDLSMDFATLVSVRQAVTKYVEEQMAPGDLAAVLPSSSAGGGLMGFTFDRRALLAACRALRWRFTALDGSVCGASGGGKGGG